MGYGQKTDMLVLGLAAKIVLVSTCRGRWCWRVCVDVDSGDGGASVVDHVDNGDGEAGGGAAVDSDADDGGTNCSA